MLFKILLGAEIANSGVSGLVLCLEFVGDVDGKQVRREAELAFSKASFVPLSLCQALDTRWFSLLNRSSETTLQALNVPEKIAYMSSAVQAPCRPQVCQPLTLGFRSIYTRARNTLQGIKNKIGMR